MIPRRLNFFFGANFRGANDDVSKEKNRHSQQRRTMARRAEEEHGGAATAPPIDRPLPSLPRTLPGLVPGDETWKLENVSCISCRSGEGSEIEHARGIKKKRGTKKRKRREKKSQNGADERRSARVSEERTPSSLKNSAK